MWVSELTEPTVDPLFHVGGGFTVLKILGDSWLTTDLQASAVSMFMVGHLQVLSEQGPRR